MNVEEIRQFVQFELSKDQSGNTLNQDEYNKCLAFANIDYFKRNYGLPETFIAGRPLGIAYEETLKNRDDMRRFKQSLGGKNLPMLSIDKNGWASYPSDYIHADSMRYNGSQIEILRTSELGDRIIDAIKRPTKKNPICAMYDTYIQFFPIDLGFVEMDYLRLPVTPFWAVTIVNDQYVYDETRSIQVEWPLDCHTDFANLVLKFATMNIREYQVEQYAKTRQTEGQ